MTLPSKYLVQEVQQTFNSIVDHPGTVRDIAEAESFVAPFNSIVDHLIVSFCVYFGGFCAFNSIVDHPMYMQLHPS